MSTAIPLEVMRKNWRYKHREQGIVLAGLQNTLIQEIYDPCHIHPTTFKTQDSSAYLATIEGTIAQEGSPWFYQVLNTFYQYSTNNISNQVNLSRVNPNGPDPTGAGFGKNKWYCCFRVHSYYWAQGTGGTINTDYTWEFGVSGISVVFSPKLRSTIGGGIESGSYWQTRYHNGTSWFLDTSTKNVLGGTLSSIPSYANCEMWCDGTNVYWRVTDKMGTMTPRLIAPIASIAPSNNNGTAYHQIYNYDTTTGTNYNQARQYISKFLLLHPAQVT
jgi:hypothetical protein